MEHTIDTEGWVLNKLQWLYDYVVIAKRRSRESPFCSLISIRGYTRVIWSHFTWSCVQIALTSYMKDHVICVFAHEIIYPCDRFLLTYEIMYVYNSISQLGFYTHKRCVCVTHYGVKISSSPIKDNLRLAYVKICLRKQKRYLIIYFPEKLSAYFIDNSRNPKEMFSETEWALMTELRYMYNESY